MESSVERVIESASEDETRRLGESLGRLLEPGDVVLLEGELGAGKTCFVQGLALGLGVSPDRRVNSPTFAIVNQHPGRLMLHHVDLYRVEDPSELAELGLAELFESGGVAAVEWAERLDRAPAHALRIRLEAPSAERRRLVARGDSPRVVALLRAW
jgi:tRNA threonylcarbamoyladenosine biosynthesis protein TsaE